MTPLHQAPARLALALLAAAAVSSCIVKPATQQPPPPYGSNPYATMTQPSGSGTSGTAVTTTPSELTEVEAKSAIMAQMQSEKIAKMTYGFTFLAEQWAPTRVEAGTDSSTLKFEIAMDPGSCIRLVAVADPGISNLDMYLYSDAEGKALLDRDISPDNYPVVSKCSKNGVSIFAETRVQSGAGWYLIHVYSKADDGTVKGTMYAVEGVSP